MGAVLTEGIQILTSGISEYAVGFGEGLVSLAESIFVEVGTDGGMQLGIVGGMVFLFAGLSLAIGLSKYFIQWVFSLGARK